MDVAMDDETQSPAECRQRNGEVKKKDSPVLYKQIRYSRFNILIFCMMIVRVESSAFLFAIITRAARHRCRGTDDNEDKTDKRRVAA